MLFLYLQRRKLDYFSASDHTFIIDFQQKTMRYFLSSFSCENGTLPVECLKGYYSDAGDEGCMICPKGFYCPTNALKAPLPCQLGEYTDIEGRTNCTVCPAGSYCNDTKSAGMVCEDGFFSSAKMSACSPCPGGYG